MQLNIFKLESVIFPTCVPFICYMYICIYIYTLTGHFIRYTLLVPGWTPFCIQNCLHSLWHRFNKVLETFLRDFGPYWHDSITQFLQICRLHIHDANLPFHHIPKMLYWIEICTFLLFVCTSLLFILLFIKSQYTVFCTSYCFAHLIVVHFLFHCTFYSYFSFFYHIYALVLCYFYIILIFYSFALSTERTWFDYISLLIIPCIIYYVTNKETLNLEPWDLVTVEVIWVKWTHCHVQETSLRWFVLRALWHDALSCWK